MQGGPMSFLEQLPPTGPVTKWLCSLSLAVSLVGSVTQRKLGIGVNELIFSAPHILDLELWRLFTFPLIERSPLGLLIGLLIFWLFGRSFEAKWGSQHFLKFIALSSIGAAIIAVPMSYLISAILPFRDPGVAEGFTPAIDAILMHLALVLPGGKILMGFVLPMNIRTTIYLLLGIQLIFGIQTGAASLSTTVGGIAMGYLLTTGNWRPRRWFRKPQRKTKPDLYVVRPPNDHTLH